MSLEGTILINRIALLNQKLRQYKTAEKQFKQLIQKCQSNTIYLYNTYNQLMNLYIETDIKQAIMLGKALNSKKIVENIPPSFKKSYDVNLGVICNKQTAYLLYGNYRDAKKKFRQVLIQFPQGRKHIMALNNLAIACWLQKHPTYYESKKVHCLNSEDIIERDFRTVEKLFRQAISLDQNITPPNLLHTNLVSDSFPKEPLNNLLTPESQIALLNLSQFLLQFTDRKIVIIFYQQSMMWFDQINDGGLRWCLNLMSRFMAVKDYQSAWMIGEKVNKQSLPWQYTSGIFFIKLGQCLQKRGKEGNFDKYKAMGKQILQSLPIWSTKSPYLIYPQIIF